MCIYIYILIIHIYIYSYIYIHVYIYICRHPVRRLRVDTVSSAEVEAGEMAPTMNLAF